MVALIKTESLPKHIHVIIYTACGKLEIEALMVNNAKCACERNYYGYLSIMH